MFPKKLHFENSSLRTGRVNEAVKYIYVIDSNLGGNKKGQAKNKFDLSSQVGKTRFELATPCTPYKCATGLRHFPNFRRIVSFRVNWAANIRAKRKFQVILHKILQPLHEDPHQPG